MFVFLLYFLLFLSLLHFILILLFSPLFFLHLPSLFLWQHIVNMWGYGDWFHCVFIFISFPTLLFFLVLVDGGLYHQGFGPGTSLYMRFCITSVLFLELVSIGVGWSGGLGFYSFPVIREVSLFLCHIFLCIGVFVFCFYFYSLFHDAYCLGFCVPIPSYFSSFFLLLSFPSCQPFSAAFPGLVLFVDLCVQVLGWVFALLVLILGMISLVWFWWACISRVWILPLVAVCCQYCRGVGLIFHTICLLF